MSRPLPLSKPAGPPRVAARTPATEATVRLAESHSDYQHIEILRHPRYGNQLVLDGDLQISVCDKAYNVAMTSPLVQLDQPATVAILGGGDGGVLNEVLATAQALDRELDKALLVDIDAEVVGLCRRYLPQMWGDAYHHPRSDVLIGDAMAFIHEANALDGVVYDLTMDPVREDQERSEFVSEITARIAESLRRGGVLSMQCCGRDEPGEAQGCERLLNDIRAAVERHFTGLAEQQVFIPSYEGRWTFLSAIKA